MRGWSILKRALMTWIVFLIFCVNTYEYPLIVTAQSEDIRQADLYARSACLMDGESGAILYGKGETIPLANASTTKILTCILALDQGDLGQQIVVSERAAKAPKVHLGAPAGRSFLLQDLLYALMLESYNDAAIMVAEGVAGSVEEFAKRMNTLAGDIGCQDTYFITPNGLDDKDDFGIHHTTASDLALIMRYCINISEKRDQFLTITETPSYSFWDCENKQLYNCSNHNAFLGMMEGAISGKTGFTADAGYCYVGALRRDGKCLIVSLLACGWPNNKAYKWSDTRKLMTYGLENFEKKELFEEDLLPGKIPVLKGQYQPPQSSASVGLQYEQGDSMKKVSMLIKKDAKISVKKKLPQVLEAPVKAGTPVGEISYYCGTKKLAGYPVSTDADVPRINYAWCLKKVSYCFFTRPDIRAILSVNILKGDPTYESGITSVIKSAVRSG